MDGFALADPMNEGGRPGTSCLRSCLHEGGAASDRIGRAPATATCLRTPYTSSRRHTAIALAPRSPHARPR